MADSSVNPKVIVRQVRRKHVVTITHRVQRRSREYDIKTFAAKLQETILNVNNVHSGNM